MKTNPEYKNAALVALKGHWAPAVVCAIVYMVITVISTVIMEFADPAKVADGVFWTLYGTSMGLMFLIMMPLQVGYYNAHKDLLLDGDDALTGNMFRIGFKNWGRNVWGTLLMGIFSFLWMLLLIIPGFVKAFAYAMTPFILVDNPELSANQAINLSQKMMKGHKFDFFWLLLSFIGWILLGIVTLGIGFFWLMPYMSTAVAGFYLDVKTEYERTNLTNN